MNKIKQYLDNHPWGWYLVSMVLFAIAILLELRIEEFKKYNLILIAVCCVGMVVDYIFFCVELFKTQNNTNN